MSSTVATQQIRDDVLIDHQNVARKVPRNWGILALMTAHVPLALLMFHVPLVSTLHAVATVLVGLWFAAFRRGKLHQVAYIGAYIVGSEVLWRMSRAQIYWETGKYAISAIFLLATLLRPRTKLPGLPLVYFAMLIPSTLITILVTENADLTYRLISFNLSGPLVLTVCACFFSQLKLTQLQLKRLLLALIFPVVGIASCTLFGTITASALRFTEESNFVTSGGFGPNQVSGILGLSALLVIICILTEKASRVFKFVMFGILIFLLVQCALTFSRGGLYNAVGALSVYSVLMMKSRRVRGKLVRYVGALFLVGYYILVPQLDAFTGGVLVTRFKDVGLAGRDSRIQAELQLWQENPILGVGTGRAEVLKKIPHTEFSRLAAEHGTFGVVAILFLGAAVLRAIMRQRDTKAKATAACVAAWGLLFMLDKAMRLAAPSFMVGLAFVLLVESVVRERRKARTRFRFTPIQRQTRTALPVGQNILTS